MKSLKTLGVGIIGAGFMGKTHTYGYVTMPLFYDNLPFRVKLVGICNRTLSKAEKLKDEFGYEFATDNYRDLLERKDIDIIDVCTPNDVHREQIVAALEAGKHVYADKPLCITDDEADDIVNRAAGLKTIHQMAFNMRFYPAVKKMKLLMDEGFIGTPISFRAIYYHASNLNPKISRGWRQDIHRSGGGVLYDMGSHAIDLVYHLLGKYEKMCMESMIVFPERADARGNMVRVETEDHVLINAHMKNGARGTIESSKVILGSNDDLNIEIYGTRGAVKFELMNPNYLWIYDARKPADPVGGERGFTAVETLNKDPDSKSHFPGPRFAVGWLRGHVACQFNFLKCVYEKTVAVPSLTDGAYIQKIMNGLYAVNNRETWINIQ